MNNDMMNRFTLNPTSLDMKRSRFPRPFDHSTTFDAGKLIPFYCEEVLPGDTVSLDLSALVRAATPIHPVMDNAFLEFQFYFVPNRLVWEHWVNFMGENTNGKWIPQTTYSVPLINWMSASNVSGKLSSNGPDVHSVADYLGIPALNYGNLHQPVANALPFRAYAKIWNDWFRDENLQDPVNIPLGDALVYAKNTGCSSSTYPVYAASSYVTDGFLGAAPLPVNKLHDYFTSALPAPQRGPDVLLPFAQYAPVVENPEFADRSGTYVNPKLYDGTFSSIGFANAVPNGKVLTSGTSSKLSYIDGSSSTNNGVFLHLAADLSSASASTINAIRFAFQLQKYYEKLARGGSRYNEVIQSFFGVHVPDERLQRSEFLGGRRIPLNMTQVAQTSSTDSITPQGNLSAFSQTADSHSYFTKSFVEHGYLFGLCFVRTARTYQQGLNKMWLRRSNVDFYNPTFANVGEMAVKKFEIYADLDGSTGSEPFGYQEAWAEYRYSPNRVSGEFRSSISGSLDSWHYADNYQSLPTLSAGWIREPQENVSRTQAVSTEVQFIANIHIDSTWTRVMPLYSIPGLVDHH